MIRSRRTASARLAVTLPLALALAACGGGGDPPGERPTSGASCPQGGTALRYTGGTPADFGRTFMTTHCTGCHASDKVGAARQGAPDHANFDSLLVIRDHLALIDQRAAAGPTVVNAQMPPGGGPTEAERRQLGEWLACGAPDAPTVR